MNNSSQNYAKKVYPGILNIEPEHQNKVFSFKLNKRIPSKHQRFKRSISSFKMRKYKNGILCN